jgi:hypothetical protein
MSAAATSVLAIQEIANRRCARDASRTTTFGAVSIAWRMQTTACSDGLSGYLLFTALTREAYYHR